MSKISLEDVQSLTNEQSALARINQNFQAIEDASDNFLSLDGTSPNSMGADLDMDENRILNLPAPVSDSEPVRLGDLDDLAITGVTGPQGPAGAQGPQGIQGVQGATGATGAAGADGDDAYVYIAYASDASGTDFTTTFNASLDYIAIKSTTAVISSPSAGDFTGLWKNYKGATGATGATGSNGSNGSNGADGTTAATTFTFSTTTTDSDPGAGTIRFNNATVASVTNLYIDNTDTGSIDVTSWLDTWDDSTNPSIKGYLTFVPILSPSNKIIFKITGSVTDGGGYRKVPVTHLAGTTLPSNSAVLAVAFSRIGDKGDTGASGAGSGDVIGPVSTVDSEIALWNGTSGDSLKSATTTGVLKATSGVLSAAVADTDYTTPSVTSLSSLTSASALATVGTITSGTWNGTAIGAAYGGTGTNMSATGGTGHVVKQNSVGGALTTGTISSSDLSDGTTGTGLIVKQTTPTLITPVLGVATATSVNKVAITAPVTSATLTIANGKTLTASNTLALAGTDGTTLTFQGTDTYVGRATTDTLTNKTINGASNTLVVPESSISLSDNTTNNVSITKHGFVPKAPNSTTTFLRGDGTWATPSASASVDWINVVAAFGAVGDGVTNDTAAINNALTAAASSKVPVYFPKGTYKITSLNTITATSTWTPVIIGDGPQASVITTSSASSTVMTVTGGAATSCIIKDLGFDSSVTRNPSTTHLSLTCSMYYLQNLRFTNISIGINSNTNGAFMDNIMFNEGATFAGFAADEYIRINNCSAFALLNNIASGPVTSVQQPNYAINVQDCDTLQITNANILRGGKCLNLSPTTGSACFGVLVDNCVFDSSEYGIYINPTGSGGVYRCFFSNTLCTSAENQGVYIDKGASASVNGLHFQNCNVSLATSSGIHIAKGTDVSIQNCLIGGNGAYGIYTVAGVSDFSIIGNSIGNYAGLGGNAAYGIAIETIGNAADRYIISNNRLTGNGTGGLVDGGTGVNKYVAGNIT